VRKPLASNYASKKKKNTIGQIFKTIITEVVLQVFPDNNQIPTFYGTVNLVSNILGYVS